MKKTVVVGASNNPSRYSYQAAHMLKQKGFDIVPLSNKKGNVAGEKILNIQNFPDIKDVHTITLYLGPQNQPPYYNYLINLKPKRIIFNPGTENPEFENLARSKGIETNHHCTLVMLSIGNY